VLEELGLREWRRDEHCHYIVYSRGAFSSAREGSNCNIFTEPPVPFDPQATADYERVSGALYSVRIGITLVGETRYGQDETIEGASIDFGDAAFAGQTYTYAPSAALPESDPGGATYTRVNDDWYMLVDPWN
jgi:hypothetical protein